MYFFCRSGHNMTIKGGIIIAIELFADARALRCVADGKIISLGELHDGVFSRRLKGDGYAVRVRRYRAAPSDNNTASYVKKWFIRLVAPPEQVHIVSPADGIVTECSEAFSIRNADGINITVFAESDIRYVCDIGDRVRRGQLIAIADRQQLCDNPLHGAIAVLFTSPQQITELHVAAGRRRAGERAAFYRVNRIKV